MSKFEIEVCSDLDYEGMVVDISDKKRRVVSLNCYKGIDRAEVVFLDPQNGEEFLNVTYEDLVETLQNAFERLKEANNI